MEYNQKVRSGQYDAKELQKKNMKLLDKKFI